MAHIIVVGAHGKVALRLLPLLTGRGDSVTGVVRNPDHVTDVEATGATAVVADVESMETEALAAMLEGHDAVVWSAGAGGGNPARTRAVDLDAAVRTVDAAERAGVQRFVMVSYLGASPEHWPAPGDPFRPYAEAKTAADAHLRASALGWTVLQPGRLTLDEPQYAVEVLTDVPQNDGAQNDGAQNDGAVSRADVAAVVASALAHPESAGRTLAFRAGTTPVDEIWTA